MKTRVLLLCNDFTGSKVHSNLYKELDNQAVSQTIFSPIRRISERGKNKFEFRCQDSKVIYSDLQKKYHRLFFHLKSNFLYNSLLRQINPSDYTITHASTLFTDGSISYKLYKKYNIPYIVAVRSTDLSIFFKYLFYLRKLGLEILQRAEKIIFINPDLKEELIKKYIPDHLKQMVLDKSICIPNGIDAAWHQNIAKPKTIILPRCSVVYVGSFLKRKNVPLLIEALSLLKDKYEISLTIAGSGGKDSENVHSAIATYGKLYPINYVGRITEFYALLDIYKNADIFVMASKNETFGLVYIEALSQGLPIIYTRNTGVSGFFKEGEVGYSITTHTASELAAQIEKVINNYEQLAANTIKRVPEFDWSLISQQYIDIYTKAEKQQF